MQVDSEATHVLLVQRGSSSDAKARMVLGWEVVQSGPKATPPPLCQSIQGPGQVQGSEVTDLDI